MGEVPHNSSHKTRIVGNKYVCDNPDCRMFGLPVGDAPEVESDLARGLRAIVKEPGGFKR